MAKAADLRRIALSLTGTVEAPHFDRAAFKVARIPTPPPMGAAPLKFTPDEQEFKCMMAPAVFALVPRAWGRGVRTIALAGPARPN
jgi:hypothetical protein